MTNYLYAIELGGDVVKVGRTRHLNQRMQHHYWRAYERGASDVRLAAIIASDRPARDELRLIAFCKERWPVAWGREYFAGADLYAITEFLIDLEDEIRNSTAA